MARTYHTDVIAFAAGADAKWIDNLLSRFAIAGVVGGKQGVSRTASVDGVYRVALIRLLTHEAGIPVALAVATAPRLLASDGAATTFGSEFLQLAFDAPGFRDFIDRRLSEATESLAPARRGRPVRRPA